MACAVFSRAARVRPHNTAVAPMLASLRAMAAPMPRPAPVMIATCVSKGRSDFTNGLQQVHWFDEQRKRPSGGGGIRILTIKWRMMGKWLAFGGRGNYNPANP